MAEIVDELKGVLQRLSILWENQSNLIRENNRLLGSIVDHQKEMDKKYERVIAKEVVIPSGDYKEFQPVNNPGYNRARVFLDAGFTPAHSGGLVVLFMYKNSVIGEVLALVSSNGSCGKASEAFDIAQLSSFYFAINNQDSAQSTTVKNFRIVLYNEARA